MSISNIWENKKSSKPPTRISSISTVMDHAFLNRIVEASAFAPGFRHSLFGVLHRCIDRVHLASLKTGRPKIRKIRRNSTNSCARIKSLEISQVSESDIIRCSSRFVCFSKCEKYPKPMTSSNHQRWSPEYLTRSGSAFGLQPRDHTHSD